MCTSEFGVIIGLGADFWEVRRGPKGGIEGGNGAATGVSLRDGVF